MEEWITTRLGSTVSRKYLQNTAKIQKEVAEKIQAVIGETEVFNNVFKQTF